MTILGVVTGLQFEAALFPPECSNLIVQCDGMGPERAERAAQVLLDRGAQALMSFGISGGLTSTVKTGQLTIASSIVHSSGVSIPCDLEWQRRLIKGCHGIGPIEKGPVAHSGTPVETVQDKQLLSHITKTASVDMESWAVATVAKKAGVPLAVMRAVADPFDKGLLPELMVGVTPEGNLAQLSAVKVLLRKPWLIPSALQIGRYSAMAQRTLRRAIGMSLHHNFWI